MLAKDLWQAFIKQTGLTECVYEAWAFGENADQLAQLVTSGEKTATASAYPLYELENEPVPEVGDYSVILDAKGDANRSLKFWKEGHEKFFTEELNKVGLAFTPGLKVVCEEFVVVYRR